MQSNKWLRWLFVTFVCVMGLPNVARAQSAIGGTVKDTSGAVLPGVTVEVASDVLIEKTKSVSTDGEGKYTIVDLRPGVYTITFSLQGFNTFKREALELPSNFGASGGPETTPCSSPRPPPGMPRRNSSISSLPSERASDSRTLLTASRPTLA